VSVGRAGAGENEEGDNPAAAAAGAAKGKVVSAMMRKHLVEGMVPVLAEVKRMLEAQRHPLLPDLMLTMRVLLKDHKSEVGSCMFKQAVNLGVIGWGNPIAAKSDDQGGKRWDGGGVQPNHSFVMQLNKNILFVKGRICQYLHSMKCSGTTTSRTSRCDRAA